VPHVPTPHGERGHVGSSISQRNKGDGVLGRDLGGRITSQVQDGPGDPGQRVFVGGDVARLGQLGERSLIATDAGAVLLAVRQGSAGSELGRLGGGQDVGVGKPSRPLAPDDHLVITPEMLIATPGDAVAVVDVRVLGVDAGLVDEDTQVGILGAVGVVAVLGVDDEPDRASADADAGPAHLQHPLRPLPTAQIGAARVADSLTRVRRGAEHQIDGVGRQGGQEAKTVNCRQGQVHAGNPERMPSQYFQAGELSGNVSRRMLAQ
jgi:hypothetical protein